MPRLIIFAVAAVATIAATPASGHAQPRVAARPAVEARPAAPDTASLELRLLRPGVWLHTSYYRFPDGTRFPSNGLVVRDGTGLLLVDTAWGEELTGVLLARIASEIGLPVRGAVLTHAHGDRLAGADLLRARGIPVLASPLTRRLALESGMPLPSDTLSGLAAAGSARALGAVELFYPGPGHAPDNLMVWMPGQRLLFGGCAVRPGTSNALGNVAHADLAGWPLALRRAAERYATAEVVVPGHGAPGGIGLLAHSIALFERP